ncbi:hypothetical protein QBC43DRAFT_347507 [Cladorrhinum sp. PSN259]|nr:hypothetical protein QBC43DRAFT_347507 [Cladorrhinum sp. PSN259]
MGSIDFDQVLFSRASWRKTVLVPAWLFQVVVLLCLMGIFAYRLAETFEHYSDEKNNGEAPMVEVVWEATNVGFNLISMVLTLLEIARHLTERLTPFLLLSSQIIKITLSLAVLGLDVVAHLRSMDGVYATIGLSLDCGLLAVNFGILLYAILTYRRLLKYEEYHINPVNQHQPPAPEQGLPHNYNYPRTVESEHRRVSGIQAYSDADTSYHSQTLKQPTAPAAGNGIPRQSHFQEQMSPIGGAPPSSNPQFKAEVDQALGSEFGSWENVDALGRNASKVMGSGTVPNRSSVISVEGVQRAHSWRTEVVQDEVDMGAGRVMGSGDVVGGRGDQEGLLLK